MAREVAIGAEREEERVVGRHPLFLVLRGLRRHPLGLFGLAVIVLFIVVAVFATWIAPFPADATSRDMYAEPSLRHLFGADRLGRDVLSRVIYGARPSLFIGLVSVAIGVGGATLLGLVSGYIGGRLDDVIQRLVDIALAFPILILLLAIVAVLNNEASAFRQFLARTPIPEKNFLGLTNFLDTLVVAFAIGLGLIAGVTRIVRGAVLSEKNNVYVEAARALGASDLRIMVRHVLPNVLALVIVLVSILLPAAILMEAALSFLGLGVPPGEPSWGGDLSGSNREAAMFGFWWPVFFPGLALSLTVLGFNMLGDALRDILDPRLRGRGLS